MFFTVAYVSSIAFHSQMLVQKCTDVQMRETTALSDGTHIDFVECSQSVLRLMPSVSINEYRVSLYLKS